MLVVLILAIRIIRQNVAELKRAKIREPDGSLRNPTISENMAIANYLAHQKGKYFWGLILLGVIIVAILVILQITGILPKLITAAAKIYAKYFLAPKF